jgi:transposase InsO family protein
MAPDPLWVADITYVRLAGGFVYLAVVLDAFSREVVGWQLEDHLAASLALTALEMALADRKPASGELVHHSDLPSFQWTAMLAFRSWRGVSDECREAPDISGVVQA